MATFFGSGFKWVSGSGSKQAKIVPHKNGKEIKEMKCLKSSLLGWKLLMEPESSCRRAYF
jgi:hypothetical protein